MQVAQVYLVVWMVGGAMAWGCLLVGNFGARAAGRFSPALAAVAGAGGASLSGAAGMACAVWLQAPEGAALGWALLAGLVGAAVGGLLQRRASLACAGAAVAEERA